MTSDELTLRIQRAFTSVFGAGAAFSPSLSRADEPRWSSLKHIEFVIALEREFKIRFDGADATDMMSIPTVLQRVSEKVQ
jgi:acyl carrier protein